MHCFSALAAVSAARPRALIAILAGVLVSLPSAANHQGIQQGRYTPMARNYDSGSTMTLRSHAVGYAIGNGMCTGTWISPTLFMTAAHCNLDPGATARMEIYPRKQLAASNSRRFNYNCRRNVAFAWLASNADLTIWECGADRNPKPGDRFGWVDYSILEYDRVGDPIYTVFGHPVQNPPNNWGWVKLYAEGSIQSVTQNSWAVPNCQANRRQGSLPYAHRTNTYESSGSLSLSMETHTAVVGPTSTGTQGAPGRNSAGFRQILNKGDLPPGEAYRIEATDPSKVPSNDPLTQIHGGSGRAKTSGGCARQPSTLKNDQATDANGNNVIDIQEKMADEITERAIYTLDFNSGWRRVLWQTGGGFRGWQRSSTASADSISKEPWQFHARVGGAEPRGEALRHEALNLAPDTAYAVRVAYREVGSRSLPKLRVAFDGPGGQCDDSDVLSLKRPSPPSPASMSSNVDWTTGELDTASCSEVALTLSTIGSGVTDLRSVTLVKEDKANWRFDLWDQREPWRSDLASAAGTYPRKSAHGFIYEVPPDESGIYSGILGADEMGEGLTLPTIPLRQCTTYDLAFKAKALDSNTEVRAITKSAQQGFGGSLLWQQVPVTSNWTSHSFQFKTDEYNDVFLRFEGLRDSDNRVAIDSVRATPAANQDKFEIAGNCLSWDALPGVDAIERAVDRIQQSQSVVDQIGVDSAAVGELADALEGAEASARQLRQAETEQAIRARLRRMKERVASATESLSVLKACCEAEAPDALNELSQAMGELEAVTNELPDADRLASSLVGIGGSVGGPPDGTPPSEGGASEATGIGNGGASTLAP